MFMKWDYNGMVNIYIYIQLGLYNQQKWDLILNIS